MEKLLNEQVISQVKQAFAQMKEPVQLLLFTSRENCDYCAEVRQLLEELAEVDEKIGITMYDLQDNADIAAQFNVDKSPVIVVAARDGDQIVNYGIQYAGIPSGMSSASSSTTSCLSPGATRDSAKPCATS